MAGAKARSPLRRSAKEPPGLGPGPGLVNWPRPPRGTPQTSQDTDLAPAPRRKEQPLHYIFTALGNQAESPTKIYRALYEDVLEHLGRLQETLRQPPLVDIFQQLPFQLRQE